MNPWKSELGCEVNLCGALDCNETRMSFCALRKAYNERVELIKQLRDAAQSQDLKAKYTRILKGMEANE